MGSKLSGSLTQRLNMWNDGEMQNTQYFWAWAMGVNHDAFSEVIKEDGPVLCGTE